MAALRELAQIMSERCTCQRLRSATRVMTRMYDKELRALGVKLSQLTVLAGVAMFGEAGAGVAPLADAIYMERTTLTRNLKPLIAARWLRSVPDPGDRRARRITLARKGEQILAAAFPIWQRVQATSEAALASHHAQLDRALDEVLARIRVDHEAAGDDD